MATIHVDGKEYEVNGADNLLQACLSLGLDIPYFCWHPALGSVGACRQCAVKQYQNKDDTRGRLVMSCMTPAIEGTFIAIDDEEAKAFRQSVVEWLLTQHPHDCPVCEEGGNCHLQDMTVMTGHRFRRYRFTKRTHQNQFLGPFIAHEMNRCIGCYRCVRYYKDYADGTDFGVYGAHNNIYFGRTEDGVLESEFSGNLTEICPTGVFTDKTQAAHYSRKWDMQFAPGICQQCSVGCNISPGERYGELRRIENRYNGEVNGYFLCDRGRFGYGYVNLHDRPRHPMWRGDHEWQQLTADKAIQHAAETLRQAKTVIGIGSPRASIESNFALQQLVGAENFSTGMGESEQHCVVLMLAILQRSGIHTPSLREMESYDAVLILGEDVTQTAARIALAVRQAVKAKARAMAAAQKIADWQIAATMNIAQGARYPLFITSTDETRLDDLAAWCYRAPADDQARLGFAIAHALDVQAPGVDQSDALPRHHLAMVAEALSNARKPLIVAGSHAGSEALLQAAANIALALKNRGARVGITFVAPAVNSIGIGLIGGMSLDRALTRLVAGEADAVVVMETDLYRHAPKTLVDTALNQTPSVIVIDHQHTATLQRADLQFPAASFAEGEGSVISQEGRAQRFFPVYDAAFYDPSVTIRESWRWLYALQHPAPGEQPHLSQVIGEIIRAYPTLKGLRDAAPDAAFRIRGQKIARSPHRYSGRTSMRANISVHEPRQPQDNDSMLAFSMEGNNQPAAPHSQIPFAWAPGWNSPQAWNKFQHEVGGSLRHGDPGIRLFESDDCQIDWFDQIPPPFIHQQEWRIAPYWHLFGSEELTQRAPVISERMPEICLVLNPQDAAQLDISAGARVELSCLGERWCLPVRFSARLQAGQVGVPLGMAGIPLCLSGEKMVSLRKVSL